MRTRFIAFFLAIATGASAFGQLPSIEPEQSPEGKEKLRLTELARTDPSLSSPVKSEHEFFNLTATKSDTAAEVQIGHKFAGNALQNSLTFLKVTAPVKKSDDPQELADLRGLQGAARIEFGLNWFTWSPAYRVNKSLPMAQQGSDLFARWKQACINEVKGFDATNGGVCGMSMLKPDTQSTLIDWGPKPRIVALSADYGSKQFNYLDATTLAKGKESHYTYGITAAAGIFPLVGGWYYTGLNFSAERSYSAQPSTRVCLPLGTTGAFQCTDAVLGAPKESTAKIVEFEARYYMGNRFALSPKVANDFDGKVRSVQLPIYFIPDDTGKLTGGITVGWRSDTKEVTAAVFVGQLTSILKKQ